MDFVSQAKHAPTKFPYHTHMKTLGTRHLVLTRIPFLSIVTTVQFEALGIHIKETMCFCCKGKIVRIGI